MAKTWPLFGLVFLMATLLVATPETQAARKGKKPDLNPLAKKGEPVTKADLDKRDAALRLEFNTKLKELRGELNGRIDGLEGQLKTGLKVLHGRIDGVVADANEDRKQTVRQGNLIQEVVIAQKKSDEATKEAFKSFGKKLDETGKIAKAAKDTADNALTEAKAARIAAENAEKAELARLEAEKKRGKDSAEANAAAKRAEENSAAALAAVAKLSSTLDAHHAKAKDGNTIINLTVRPSRGYVPPVRRNGPAFYVYENVEFAYIDDCWYDYNPHGWAAPVVYSNPLYSVPAYYAPTYYAPTLTYAPIVSTNVSYNVSGYRVGHPHWRLRYR